MRCVLPAGTEVVIRVNDNAYSWYTTKEEIDVTDYKTGICPLRQGLEVLTSIVKGIPVWFLESQVKVILPKELTVKTLNQKFVTLEYDIPIRVSTRPQDYPDESGRSFQHPSLWMWGIGARTTKSVWLLPADKIPYRRIRTLIRAGCNYRVTYIDNSDVLNHLQRTVISLRNEWISADNSYNECMQSALERFNQRVEEQPSEVASHTRKLQYDRNRVEKELQKKQENIMNGARILNIPLEWVCEGKMPLTSVESVDNETATVNVNSTLRNNIVAGRSLMDARVDAHCNAVDALNANGTDESKAIAKSLENGTLPHAIAADYIEEKEIVPPDNSDGTYSLRDLFKDE